MGCPSQLFLIGIRCLLVTFGKHFSSIFEIPLNMSTAYHPQTDGQTERVNQCLEMYLRCAVSSTPTKWSSWLPLAQFWYNTSFHSSLQCSPHKALYGVDPTYGLLPAHSASAFETGVSTSLDADALL